MNVLLAAMLLSQDSSAETTFKKLQEGLEEAKTVSIGFTVDTAVTDTRSGTTTRIKTFGNLLLNRTEKMCFFVAQDTKDGPARIFLNYEESRVTENLIHRSALSVSPESLGMNLVRAFTISGSHGVRDWLDDSGDITQRRTIVNYPLPTSPAERKDTGTVEASEVRDGEDSGKEKSLKYTATHRNSGETYQVTLWYEPPSLHPKRRILTRTANTTSTVLVETYHVFGLNVDIADEVFWKAFGESAEAVTLRNIERLIEKASTVRAKFSCDLTIGSQGKSQKSHLTGELLLKSGKKIRLSTISDTPGQAQRVTTEISDGTRISGVFLRESKSKDPAGTFGEYLKSAVARSGIVAGGILAGESIVDSEFRFKERMGVCNVRAGQDEKEGKTLSYQLMNGVESAEVKLWYDPKDYRLLKRTLTVKAGGPGSIFVETYDDFKLNADIPDDLFVIPEEK